MKEWVVVGAGRANGVERAKEAYNSRRVWTKGRLGGQRGCVRLQFPAWWLRVPWPSQQVSGELYLGVRISPPIFNWRVGAVVQERI